MLRVNGIFSYGVSLTPLGVAIWNKFGDSWINRMKTFARGFKQENYPVSMSMCFEGLYQKSSKLGQLQKTKATGKLFISMYSSEPSGIYDVCQLYT